MKRWNTDVMIAAGCAKRFSQRARENSSFYGQDAYRKIYAWGIPNTDFFEDDGKMIFNKTDDDHWCDLDYFYCDKEGAEASFIDNLPVGLRPQYLWVVVEGLIPDWERGYSKYYCLDAEGKVMELNERVLQRSTN